MPELLPASASRGDAPTVGAALSAVAAADRRTSRALANVQRNTLVRMASVQGHAIVQNEKVHEIDRLSREAMSGQAMLSQWASTIAHGDPFLADDLKFFADIAKLGKGEIIADTISDFCQEGRR
jgi:hypothetical protein